LPLYYRKPPEFLLEEAERNRALLMSLNGQEGGKQKDELQLLIERTIANNPKMSRNRLLHRLREERNLGIILDVTDSLIIFERPDGELVEASLPGLKDRLSRASKEIIAKAGKGD